MFKSIINLFTGGSAPKAEEEKKEEAQVKVSTPEPVAEKKEEPVQTVEETIYVKIGGEDAVNAAVDIFYRKVLGDDRIKDFFETVDMEEQAAKQKAFLTMVFGGPNNYTGEDMRKGHAHLVEKGLDDTHFDAVMEHLGATLQELEVPGALITEVAAIAESTRSDVLGR